MYSILRAIHSIHTVGYLDESYEYKRKECALWTKQFHHTIFFLSFIFFYFFLFFWWTRWTFSRFLHIRFFFFLMYAYVIFSAFNELVFMYTKIVVYCCKINKWIVYCLVIQTINSMQNYCKRVITYLNRLHNETSRL